MNQTILILAEKPSYTRDLAPFVSAKWPTARLIAHYVNFGGPFRFKYPRGLTWSDYPRIQDRPAYHLTAEHWIPPSDLVGGRVVRMQESAPDRDIKHAILGADQIVFACDPDYAGALAFHTAVTECLGEKIANGRSFPAIWLRSLDDAGIRASMNSLKQFPDDFRPLLTYGLAKRYFDFNFNMNAIVILGQTLATAGIDPVKYQLSKYAIQVLFHLKHEGPTDRLYSEMHDWRGTGKHTTVTASSSQCVQLGSAASIGNIVSDLTTAGLTSESQRKVSLTPCGERVLSLLHPGCEDRDLPFRLRSWCEAGLVHSKESIDRYLRTYFGRQKRFLKAHSL